MPLLRFQSRPTQLMAAAGLAIGVIVCVLFAGVAVSLHVSAISLDRQSTRSEAKLLHSLIEGERKTLANGVADYTAWTELYDYLKGPRDPKWEHDSLGPYISKMFPVDALLIASRTGDIVYSYSREPHLAGRLIDKKAIGRLSRRSFALQRPGIQVPASGFLNLNGIPALVAAAPIRDSASREPAGYVLIEVRTLTPAALQTLGRQYDIAGLTPTRSAHGIALKAPSGALAPFRLGWQPANPGHEIYLRMLPMLLIFGLAALAAIFAIAAVATRLLAQMRRGERRLQNAELRASLARAEAAEDLAHSKSAFIANMSHELRTPLNAIIGFSDLMLTEASGPVGVPKYREYLNAIHGSGHHLLNIVSDILNLSKIEAGKSGLALQTVAIGNVLREAALVVEPMAAKKNIRLGIGNSAHEILADPQALQQVLLNLLSNAIKFSPNGAAVEIRARDMGEACEIAVTDRGCGMPEELLRDLGKPFVQAEGVYNRSNQGTGLGLAISFMLVRAMNGAISVKSEVGNGTAVTISLPKAGEQAETKREAVAA